MSKKIVISSSMKFRSLVKATMKNLEELGFNPSAAAESPVTGCLKSPFLTIF